jgi:hypothetical protein
MTIASHHAKERCGDDLGCLSEEAKEFFYYHFVYVKPSAQLVAKALVLLMRRGSQLSLQSSVSRAKQTQRRRTGRHERPKRPVRFPIH